MWKKPCKTGDPEWDACSSVRIPLNNERVRWPYYMCCYIAWCWSGTSPVFLSFYRFNTCRLDILIRVLSGFEVFLPILSLTSLWTLCSFMSLWMLSSLMSWETSIWVSCAWNQWLWCGGSFPLHHCSKVRGSSTPLPPSPLSGSWELQYSSFW